MCVPGILAGTQLNQRRIILEGRHRMQDDF